MVFQEKDASENAEALSKEELGRLVASRWTGEVDAGKDDKHEISEDAPSDAHDEEYEGYDSESEDDSQKYNEDDDEEEEEEDHVEDFEEEKHDDFSSPDKSTSDDELDVPGLQLLLQCSHANVKPFFIVSFCSCSQLKLPNGVFYLLLILFSMFRYNNLK